MSEAEMSAPVERESNVVKRVTEKVGQFLKETYTTQGMIAKDMRKYAKLTENNTFYTRRAKMEAYQRLAEKHATWKVIGNWVLTGAGLAVGGTAILRPDLIVGAVGAAADKLVPFIKGVIGAAKLAAGNIGHTIGAAATGTKEFFASRAEAVKRAVLPAGKVIGQEAQFLKNFLWDYTILGKPLPR